jgi:hypothetical protein
MDVISVHLATDYKAIFALHNRIYKAVLGLLEII